MYSSKLKAVAKILALSVLGLSTMANEGCKEEPVVPQRKLRKLVEIGRVDAGNFSLPGGGNFDFEYVANAQMFSLVSESKDFTLLYSTPGTFDTFGLSSVDAELYEEWSGGEVFNPADFSQEAQCLLDMPQVKIDADVLSFQVVNGGGLSIGYGPTGSFDASLIPSASVEVQNARLDVSIHGKDPLSRVVLGSAMGVAHHRKFDVGLTINFGNFRLGPKYFFESPLAGVTEAGIEKALSQLASNMDDDTWYTRLMADQDSHIVIQAGANANLKVGDVVAVYNETHAWDGKPCFSELKGSFKEPATPVMKAKITSVGPAIAQAEVDRSYVTRYRPQIGARVEVLEMAPEPKAAQ